MNRPTLSPQRLTRWPEGLFYLGHSGKRFSAADMPRLRALRATYRSFLDAIPAIAQGEKDPAMLLAITSVKMELQAKFDACGHALDLLERTSPSWRP